MEMNSDPNVPDWIKDKANTYAYDYCWAGMYGPDEDCFYMFKESDEDFVRAYNDEIERLMSEYFQEEKK